MLKPSGFWSYSLSDDESSRGQLSQLRERVAAELQLHIGREKVSIFQDSASIPPGGAWESQIRESLRDVSFFIPVLTTAFLQSSWCCREVMLFRHWEAARGRDDLIFPVQYVDIDEADSGRSIGCFDEEVLKFLRGRQWVDFRSLRFKPYDFEEISLKILKIAKAIRDALRKAGTVTRSTTKTTELAEVQRVDAINDPAETPTAAVRFPAREVPALSSEILDRVGAILTEFMGPKSKLLVAKESQGVASLKELAHRLAKHIPTAEEREEFINRV